MTLELGEIVATTGMSEWAATDTAARHAHVQTCLGRHHNGDWGDLSDDDKVVNDRAVKRGARVLSAYPLDPTTPFSARTNCLMIVTENGHTTVFLPWEY